MQDPIYRVQFIDDHGEIAFTDCSSSQRAIDRACRMQKHAIVQGIVNDVTGDIHMTADQIRDEARLRSERVKKHRDPVLNHER